MVQFKVLITCTCPISDFIQISDIDTTLSFDGVENGSITCSIYSSTIELTPGEYSLTDSQGIIRSTQIIVTSDTELIRVGLKQQTLPLNIQFKGTTVFDPDYENSTICAKVTCPSTGKVITNEIILLTLTQATYKPYISLPNLDSGIYELYAHHPDSTIIDNVTITDNPLLLDFSNPPSPVFDFGVEPVTRTIHKTITTNITLLNLQLTAGKCPISKTIPTTDIEYDAYNGTTKIIPDPNQHEFNCTENLVYLLFKESYITTDFNTTGTSGSNLQNYSKGDTIAFVEAPDIDNHILITLNILINETTVWDPEIESIEIIKDYSCRMNGPTKPETQIITQKNYKGIIKLNDLYGGLYKGYYNIQVYINTNTRRIFIDAINNNSIYLEDREHITHDYNQLMYIETSNFTGNMINCELSLPYNSFNRRLIGEYSKDNPSYNLLLNSPNESSGVNVFDSHRYMMQLSDNKDDKYEDENIIFILYPPQLSKPLCDEGKTLITDLLDIFDLKPDTSYNLQMKVDSSSHNSYYQLVIRFYTKNSDDGFDEYFTSSSRYFNSDHDTIVNLLFKTPSKVLQDTHYTIYLMRIQSSDGKPSRRGEVWEIRNIDLREGVIPEYTHNCNRPDNCPFFTLDGIDSNQITNDNSFKLDRPTGELISNLNSIEFKSNSVDGRVITNNTYEPVQITLPVILTPGKNNRCLQEQFTLLDNIISYFLLNPRLNGKIRERQLKLNYNENYYDVVLTGDITPQIDDKDNRTLTMDLEFTVNSGRGYKSYKTLKYGEVDNLTPGYAVNPVLQFHTNMFMKKGDVLNIVITDRMSNTQCLIYGYLLTKDIKTDNSSMIVDMEKRTVYFNCENITKDIPIKLGWLRLEGSYDLHMNLVDDKVSDMNVYGREVFNL
ncbi:MAG: hypothetical protein LBB45_03295 [Methanobrevibacter sp.]|nr:hypothetical protein [Candidatus Methanovirga basalitermitum]